MIESYILMRSVGDSVSGYGPKGDDLTPYQPMAWEDVTERLGVPEIQELEPRLIIIRARYQNGKWPTISNDNKLWLIRSRLYDEETYDTIDDDREEVYSEAERTLRINQLSNFAGFDSATIGNWWTPSKTKQQVAVKLIKYFRTLDSSSE